MKALLVISVCVCTLALADSAAKAPAAKAAVPAKTDKKAKTADAGLVLKEAAKGTLDAGVVAAKDADAGVKAEKPAADAGTPLKDAAKDGGVKTEAKPDTGKGGAKYTLVAVPAPDKATERSWKAKCGSCHGADGKAATEKGKKMKLPDFSQAAWQTSRDDAELRTAIVKGVKEEKDGVKKEMDAFETELNAEQIDALVKYVRFVGAPK